MFKILCRGSLLLLWLLTLSLGVSQADETMFRSAWPPHITRQWIGPEYWANRLEDWRINIGRLECLQADRAHPMRTVHLITHEMIAGMGDFSISIRTGMMKNPRVQEDDSWSGFLIGAGQGRVDYRAASLIHHLPGQFGGLICALDNTGRPIFRSNEQDQPPYAFPLYETSVEWDRTRVPRGDFEDYELRLTGIPEADGTYTLSIAVYDYARKELLTSARMVQIDEAFLRGNIALVSHGGRSENAMTYWFRDLQVTGTKIKFSPERRFGPILGTLYSLHERNLKMTVQFPPLGFSDTHSVTLQFRPIGTNDWTSQTEGEITTPGYIATFHLPDWDEQRDYEYRLTYPFDGEMHEYYGRITHNPREKEEITLAALSGNHPMGRMLDMAPGGAGEDYKKGRWTAENLWFPYAPLIQALADQRPDLLIFTGEQVYSDPSPENSMGNGRNPELDFLHHWFLWHWAYQPLTRRIPCVILPNPSDIYQTQLWGAGGIRNITGNPASGGYMQEAHFINMVQRLMSSHNPGATNPRPVIQNIETLYGGFQYGGIGFFALEDRKFKSIPSLIPNIQSENGIITAPNYNPVLADIPGTQLLGESQLKEVQDWCFRWNQAEMKVLLTPSLFAAMETGPSGEKIMDLDSNGWPQGARRRILDLLRRNHVLIIGGDSHLPALVQFGLEDWRDAGYQFSPPPVASKWRTWWNPATPGENQPADSSAYLGNHTDAFANKITVHAVANPKISAQQSLRNNTAKGLPDWRFLVNRELNNDGYGIVRLHKKEQTIVFEAWPWNSHPQQAPQQFPGWPVTIHMADLYNRQTTWWLPTLRISNRPNAVIHVIDESNNETLYMTRALQGEYAPRVFHDGSYTIRVSEPGTSDNKTLDGLKPTQEKDSQTRLIRF
jgi:alkaline phosphatase D